MVSGVKKVVTKEISASTSGVDGQHQPGVAGCSEQRGTDQRHQAAGKDGGQFAAHGNTGEAVLGAEQFGQERALRAQHGLHAQGDAHHHDHPHERDVAQGDQVERREGDEAWNRAP